MSVGCRRGFRLAGEGCQRMGVNSGLPTCILADFSAVRSGFPPGPGVILNQRTGGCCESLPGVMCPVVSAVPPWGSTGGRGTVGALLSGLELLTFIPPSSAGKSQREGFSSTAKCGGAFLRKWQHGPDVSQGN